MAAAVYFVLVFGAGFALGPVRVLWLVPRVGERTAELLEAPVMFAVILLSSRFVTKRFGVRSSAARLVVGVAALALVLLLELTVVLGLRGLTLSEYVDSRDPVAGAVYCGLLVWLAAAPLLVARSRRR
jgi:hypothetical protein